MTAPRPVRAMVLAVGLLTIPLSAEAQPGAKIPRIGFLVGGTEGDPLPSADAFRQGLRGLGYVEGRNIAIEYRYAEGRSSASPTSRPGWFASRST